MTTQNDKGTLQDRFLYLDNLFDAQDKKSTDAPIDPMSNLVLLSEMNKQYPATLGGPTVSNNPIDFGTPKEEAIEKIVDGTVVQEAAKPANSVVNNVTYETNNYSTTDNSTTNTTVHANNSNHATSSPSSIISSANVESNINSTDDVAYNTYVNSMSVSDINRLYEKELRENSIEKQIQSNSNISTEKLLNAQNDAGSLTERELEDKITTTYNSMYDGGDVNNITENGAIVQGASQVNGGNVSYPTTNQASTNTYVKSNKIMDQSTISRAVEPDKSVERSVNEQTKVLNETINNLNSSVSNMSQPVAQSTVNTEGSTTNTNNSTTINQAEKRNPPALTEAKDKEELKQDSNSEFYLQAIYAALVSGKIKVKLEYT